MFAFIHLSLSSTSLGFIVYGSETFHYSYQDLTQNILNFSSQFDKLSNDTSKIKGTVINDFDMSLSKITNELNKVQTEGQQINKAKKEIESIRITINESIIEIEALNRLLNERYLYKNILKEIDYVEQIR